MIEARGRGTTVATVVLTLTVIETVTFVVAASLHLGAQYPLGFAVLAEPRILPAAIVEGLAGLSLAAGAYGWATRQSWGWPAAVGAHVLAGAGVLLGIAALAAGAGPRTALNDVYHRVILLALLVNLGLLATPAARAAPGGGDRPRRSGPATP